MDGSHSFPEQRRSLAALECPACCEGAVGFFVYERTGTMLLCCEACEAAWHHPEEIDASTYFMPPEGHDLRGHWATVNEITACGWSPYIIGVEEI